MKKQIFLLLFTLSLVGTTGAFAQGTFDKGDNVLNVTIGFGSGLYNGAYYSGSPAIGASFEHCFFDNLINGDFSVGIGGYFGFTTSKYDYLGYGWKYTYLIPAARGTFHWNGIENLDLYAGLHIGARIVSYKEIGTPTGLNAQGSGGYFSPFVGARYYFNDKFAAVAEFGSGIAYANIGAAIKF